MTTYDPYGNPWASVSAWADDSTQLGSLRPDWEPGALDTTEALAAAQTWQEVLSVPIVPRDNLTYFAPFGETRRLPRTSAPAAETPGRGNITHHRADGTVVTLARDGSPITAAGKSSKRSGAAHRAAATKRAKSRAKLAALVASPAPAPASPAPRYVMEDGEPVAIVG